jgi:hypothetical protein
MFRREIELQFFKREYDRYINFILITPYMYISMYVQIYIHA